MFILLLALCSLCGGTPIDEWKLARWDAGQVMTPWPCYGMTLCAVTVTELTIATPPDSRSAGDDSLFYTTDTG